MGIINLNSDSFWEGSRVADSSLFLERFEKMVEDGADIVDIGACSTRPGSLSISVEEEWSRLAPILKLLSKRESGVKLSIDTFRGEIVRRSFDSIGQFIVNDISSGEDDATMLESVGALKLPYIAMHKRGTPQFMQQNCNYEDVVKEVREYLIGIVERAASYGIEDIMVDPGFGFSKNIDQNYTLLNSLSNFKFKGINGKVAMVVVGLSRKSMIYNYLQIDVSESLNATSALELVALLNGADILRTHDPKEAKEMVKLYQILYRNRELR